MKTLPQDHAISIGPEIHHPDAEPVAAPRNDVDYLSAYEAAAREIFISANGLLAYYRTYYKAAGEAGWAAASRQGDWDQAVWRQGAAKESA